MFGFVPVFGVVLFAGFGISTACFDVVAFFCVPACFGFGVDVVAAAFSGVGFGRLVLACFGFAVDLAPEVAFACGGAPTAAVPRGFPAGSCEPPKTW